MSNEPTILEIYRAARAARQAVEQQILGDKESFVRDVLPYMTDAEMDDLFHRLDVETRSEVALTIIREMRKEVSAKNLDLPQK